SLVLTHDAMRILGMLKPPKTPHRVAKQGDPAGGVEHSSTGGIRPPLQSKSFWIFKESDYIFCLRIQNFVNVSTTIHIHHCPQAAIAALSGNPERHKPNTK
ncbi:MAG: hypothetical protein QM523_06840, partial [Candidatus Pacebacteria bacterium]|nr:hypothetical protein [Candidatus Paceibacterota bacterium]